MKCPNPQCRAENEDFYQYCMTCGTALHAQPHELLPEPSPAAQVEDSLTSGGDWLAAQPEAQAEVLVSGGGHQVDLSAPASRSPALQQTGDSVTVITQPGVRPQPERQYGQGGVSPLNPWGPFAGYGTRRRHTGWLMDTQGHRSDELIGMVEQKFNQRRIPRTGIVRRSLTARGVLVETRPYFLLKRGLATVALYIAAFGQDLFISQASYLKPPISPLRVLILLAMLAFQFFMYYFFPVMFNQRLNDLGSALLNPFGGGGADVGGLIALSCLVGPLGLVNTIALILFALYSLYKFLTEKDILAGLRVPPNEFNEDDLMAMEKAVEQTVRIALTDLRLNPDDLRVAGTGRGGQLF